MAVGRLQMEAPVPRSRVIFLGPEDAQEGMLYPTAQTSEPP